MDDFISIHFVIFWIDFIEACHHCNTKNWLTILWMNIKDIDYLKYDNCFNGGTNPQQRYILFLLHFMSKLSILESILISIMGTQLVWKI